MIPKARPITEPINQTGTPDVSRIDPMDISPVDNETRSTPSVWEKQDIQKGKDLLDAFISFVNADEEDAITISRNKGCYMRDEIERLRKIEVYVRDFKNSLKEFKGTL
jgi:hypothetical protein